LLHACRDSESAVRYWGTTGLLIRGEAGVRRGRDMLLRGLNDPSHYVRIVAAEALAKFGELEDRDRAIATLKKEPLGDVFVGMAVLGTVDELGKIAAPLRAGLVDQPMSSTPHSRYDSYVPRLLERLQ
jgi:uncharacterized sulfatase